MSGNDQLRAMIDRVQALGGLAADVAREAAPLVQEAARSTVRAGPTPDGKPWAAKKDGGKPLANAANAVTAAADGAVVTIKLSGPEVFHNAGVGKTTPKRKIIPESGDPIPASVAEALATAAQRAFDKAVRRG